MGTSLTLKKQKLAKFKKRTWERMNRRTINGYNSQPNEKRYSSYFKKGIKINITRSEFFNWCDSQSEIIWQMYKTNLTPSIDRIDSNGHYELGNIQILSTIDNIRKVDRSNNGKHSKLTSAYKVVPVVAILKNGKVVEANSIKQLALLVDIAPSFIRKCLNKTLNSVLGCEFFYKKDLQNATVN